MTKRTRLGAVVAIGICASAYASEATADGDPKSFAAPSQAFSWTGYYVGAQLGGLANLSEISDPLGPSIFGNPNLAGGPFAGLQAGYNYQSGVVVYGLEAEIAFARTEGTSTCSSVSGWFINSNCRTGLDTFGTLAGRLGLALGPDGRSLIYGKAGAAWYTGDVDLATSDWTKGQYGNPYGVRGDNLSRWGWTLGAGAEYALDGNWSMKAEYGYANFGKQDITLLPSVYMASNADIEASVPARQGQLSNELHSFKVGLNYRFGDRPDPSAEPAAVSLKDDPGAGLHRFGLEVGGRYWYSWGRHKYDLGLGTAEPGVNYALISRLTYDDIDASTGEVTARLNAPYNLFAKGFIGGGTISGGHMNDEDFNINGDQETSPGVFDRVPYTNTISPKVEGDIPSYGTIDVGYDAWRAPGHRAGIFIGYNNYSETMGAYGVAQTANPNGPFGPGTGDAPLPPTGHAIITQDATWQSLRLGAGGEFNLAPRLRLSAEAAYLPYVWVDATDMHFQGNGPKVSSVNEMNGTGVGAQIEAMLSYDVTDHWSIGVGARYWTMWTTDATELRVYNAGSTGPGSPQHVKLETERAGVLGQVLYKFD
jgi:opacity protein-like surface antigen